MSKKKWIAAIAAGAAAVVAVVGLQMGSRGQKNTDEVVSVSETAQSSAAASSGSSSLGSSDSKPGWKEHADEPVTLVSKNCSHPDRAIQFIDYFLSEHGQQMIYLGVEGEMWDYVDGVPKVHDDIMQVRDSDRTTYDRVYGADDTYWMLQVNTMQMQWEQDTKEPMKSLREWSYPYAYYNGQYDGALVSGSAEESENERIDELWSETLPQLLMASDDDAFDQLMTEFTTRRNELGFEDVMKAKTKSMEESKKKLGLE